jgi:hypothetical protein
MALLNYLNYSQIDMIKLVSFNFECHEKISVFPPMFSSWHSGLPMVCQKPIHRFSQNSSSITIEYLQYLFFKSQNWLSSLLLRPCIFVEVFSRIVFAQVSQLIIRKTIEKNAKFCRILIFFLHLTTSSNFILYDSFFFFWQINHVKDLFIQNWDVHIKPELQQ